MDSAASHYHSGGRSSVASAIRQPFSLSSDFHAANPVSGWLPYFSSRAHYTPSYTHQYPGRPPYHQGQRLVRLTTATKEARKKKRLARQRRFSPLRHHRSQKQHQQDQPQSQQQHSYSTALPLEFCSRPPSEGQSTTSHHSSSRNSSSRFSMASSSQQINPTVDARPPPPNSSAMRQAVPQPSTMLLQQQNSERNSLSSDGRQVGSKAWLR